MKTKLYENQILISLFIATLMVAFAFNLYMVGASYSSSSSSSSTSEFSSSSSSSYSYSVVSLSTFVKVSVCSTCVDPKPTCSVNLNPTSIISGGSSTLAWSSTGANSASFNQGIGSVSISDSKNVFPSSNTTYTGTFTGPGGTTSCSATLSVNNPPVSPTCSLSLSKTSIASGEKSVLSWSSSNVDSVSFNQGIGNVSVTGSSDVFPSSNTTYTGTFTGPDGVVNCSSSIEIISDPESPSCSMGVGSSVLNKGQSTILYWSSNNISTTTIGQNIGLVNNSGSIIINPSSNTTYIGTFEGKDGVVTCKAGITLKGGGGGGENPPNVSLSSNTFGTEPSFIYLSQIPYTGIPNFAVYLFRALFFGGLLYLYYRISGRNWKVKTK